MDTVGGRIQTARVAAGLTQEQLAVKIGVTKSAISQWESGRISALTAENLIKLADALEVSARWIWLWKERGGDHIPMGRPVHLEPDQSDLLETFKLLPVESRDVLLDDAHKYLRIAASQQPSKANPFPAGAKRHKKPVR
jgi:transcriptional regulator with XRE-family HTH domain